MRKDITKIVLMSVLAIFLMASICLSKEMIVAGSTCYLIDDNSDICKNELFFDGKYSRYFGEDGKMVVGWYTNIEKGDTYYFDTKEGETYGTMVAGMREIEGCIRIFCSDGSQANGSLIKNKTNYKAIDGNIYNIDENGYVYDLDGNFLGDGIKSVSANIIKSNKKRLKKDSKQIFEEAKNEYIEKMSPQKKKLINSGAIVSKKIK